MTIDWVALSMTAVAFSAGVFIGHMDRASAPPPITESVFGWADVAADYPHCQTDMTHSDQWSPRLMYLNGIWTAACVAQSAERHIPRGQK